MTDRFAVVAHRCALLLAAAGVLAATGCTSGTSLPPAPATAAVASEPATTAPGGSAPAGPAASAPATGSSAGGAPTSSAPTTGFLNATIGVPPGIAQLSFGGAPVEFTVTLTNGTSHAYLNITPLVSIGHCTCNPGPVPVAPQGTLQVLSNGTWKSVFYDTEGSGMDYLLANIIDVPPFTLAAGASASFTFRLALKSGQSSFRVGQTTIDLTVIQLPGRKVIGSSPAASVPVAIER